MKDYTKNHGLIGDIGNRSNHFRTTVEPNLNIYFNIIMRFEGKFVTRVVRDKPGFSLQYHKINSYGLTL